MDPNKVLKDAWTAVEQSGVPPKLYATAFNRAVDLLVAPGGQPPITPPSSAGQHPPAPPPPGKQGNSEGKQTSGGTKSEKDFYETMSKATGISEAALQRLIDIHDGAPRIALKVSQLPSASAKAQKVVSLLLILARHYYNDENEIELSVCAEECKRLTCLDNNLKRNLGLIPDLILVGEGAETKAKVREPLVKSSTETLKKLKVNLD
jgi:hypothetical protein